MKLRRPRGLLVSLRGCLAQQHANHNLPSSFIPSTSNIAPRDAYLLPMPETLRSGLPLGI
jgi:hypothetical protein